MATPSASPGPALGESGDSVGNHRLRALQLQFHAGDLGNFTVIGPSGTGKTALLTFLIAQANSSNRAWCSSTRTAAPRSSSAQPAGATTTLAARRRSAGGSRCSSDTAENRTFLIDGLERLLALPGARLDAEERAILADAIDASYTQDAGHRRPAVPGARLFARGAPAPTPATWPRGWAPGARTANTPGCSTTPKTVSTSRPTCWALT